MVPQLRSKGGTHVFKQNIQKLCDHVGEGAGWKKSATPPGGGDGKLDVVSWRKFNDGRPGNLIGFAQCKTGINWKEHLDRLQPAKFSRQYMRESCLIGAELLSTGIRSVQRYCRNAERGPGPQFNDSENGFPKNETQVSCSLSLFRNVSRAVRREMDQSTHAPRRICARPL